MGERLLGSGEDCVAQKAGDQNYCEAAVGFGVACRRVCIWYNIVIPNKVGEKHHANPKC